MNRVLIVDSDRERTVELARNLHTRGYEAVNATSYIGGLRALKNHQPIGLVIADISTMGGVAEFGNYAIQRSTEYRLREGSTSSREKPVIVVLTHDHPAYRERESKIEKFLQSANLDAVVLPNLHPAYLLHVLNQAFGGVQA